jgi:Lrp/AsnC family transcriptional regulator for asnA, asnC and gidA
MTLLRELDAKILKCLLADGRTSFVDMAKTFGVTKNKIWKRYRTLEKKGIITGATVQINFTSFGYDALATLLISVEAQQIDEVMKYIGKITEVRAYRQYNSVYNVRAVATLKDLNQLDAVKETIRRQLPTIGLKTFIWTNVRNIPENLKLVDSQTSTKVEKKELQNTQPEITRSKIDELDLQIVDKLAINGRAPFSKIAQELGTTTDTVIKRYQKLKASGAIKVSIQIDPNKLGYGAILDFNIAFTASDNLPKISEELAKIPDIIIITKTSGDFDLQLTAMVKNLEQMLKLQDEISRVCGITKMEVTARRIPTKWPTPRQYISTF